ncbi:hypothetical protein EDB82DRAFT_493353 [Fusarium venenatum]|uniref:uncharacterized protein n=1 Tax=Fusarium venenatum TaxID=56646 RepID=UPI001D2EA20B|nr:hypothetical protein EDB82DRAFT_493353 [Fusarium venenatum]
MNWALAFYYVHSKTSCPQTSKPSQSSISPTTRGISLQHEVAYILHELLSFNSAIPALFVASLSAWLAYLALRRRNISRNDIETSIIGSILSQTVNTPPSLQSQSPISQTSSNFSTPSENLPQLPPIVLLSDFNWEQRRTRPLSSTTMADRDQSTNE